MLLSLDTSKSNTVMLKATVHLIAKSVTMLFSKPIALGAIPKEWKLSAVVPIPMGKDSNKPSNYRPISLLSILSKLLKRHSYMYKLVYEHLESTIPLASQQWGFRTGRSSVAALLDATHRWFRSALFTL